MKWKARKAREPYSFSSSKSAWAAVFGLSQLLDIGSRRAFGALLDFKTNFIAFHQ